MIGAMLTLVGLMMNEAAENDAQRVVAGAILSAGLASAVKQLTKE